MCDRVNWIGHAGRDVTVWVTIADCGTNVPSMWVCKQPKSATVDKGTAISKRGALPSCWLRRNEVVSIAVEYVSIGDGIILATETK